MLAVGLVVGEEEEFVAEDGAADCAAEDGLGEGIDRGDRGGVLVGPTVGVELVVLEEAEDAAMEAVGAALHDHDDVAAVDVAELGVGVRGDDANLIEGVGTGVVADGVVEVLVDLLAVEEVVVGLLPVAVDVGAVVRVGGALGRVLAAVGAVVGGDGAGGEDGELREVTAVEREAVDGVLGEGLAGGGVLGLEDGLELIGDFDGGVGSADGEGHVDLGGLIDFEGEGTEGGDREAGGFGDELVLAGGVGGGDGGDVGGGVGDRDFDVRDDRAGGVRHGSANGAGDGLGETGGETAGEREGCENQGRPGSESLHVACEPIRIVTGPPLQSQGHFAEWKDVRRAVVFGSM